MRSLILDFFLLVLKIAFNFNLDVCYKRNRFSKILLEKSFKFVLYKKNSTIVLNLSFVLLAMEIDLIIKK